MTCDRNYSIRGDTNGPIPLLSSSKEKYIHHVQLICTLKFGLSDSTNTKFDIRKDDYIYGKAFCESSKAICRSKAKLSTTALPFHSFKNFLSQVRLGCRHWKRPNCQICEPLWFNLPNLVTIDQALDTPNIL